MTVSTDIPYNEFREFNFSTNHMKVTDILFLPNKRYGPFYLVSYSNKPDFFKSIHFCGEKEKGHWVGFIRPTTIGEARIFWALPSDTTYRFLWEVYLNPITNDIAGFVGVPQCKEVIGQTLAMNLNNRAIDIWDLKLLCELVD